LHGCDGALDVAGKASVDAGPCEGALDDPALELDEESSVGTPDDFDGTGRGIGDARALVAGVREEALEERKAPGDAVEDQRRAVAVLDAGRTSMRSIRPRVSVTR
jgi:hypothetical protein